MKAVVMGIAILALTAMSVLVLRRTSQATNVTAPAPITSANVGNGANSDGGPAFAKQNPRLTEAAFRDGLYQGTLDPSQCRPAHITTGRWSREQDRALFTKGYRHAYQRISAARNSADDDTVAANMVASSASCRE